MSEKSNKPMVTETFLELVKDEQGTLLLREVHNKDEVLVSINFSNKIKELLGDDVQFIGEHMIQAAMAAVMKQQLQKYHAHIYDVEPKRFS